MLRALGPGVSVRGPVVAFENLFFFLFIFGVSTIRIPDGDRELQKIVYRRVGDLIARVVVKLEEACFLRMYATRETDRVVDAVHAIIEGVRRRM